jgi:hypothetical protein
MASARDWQRHHHRRRHHVVVLVMYGALFVIMMGTANLSRVNLRRPAHHYHPPQTNFHCCSSMSSQQSLQPTVSPPSTSSRSLNEETALPQVQAPSPPLSATVANVNNAAAAVATDTAAATTSPPRQHNHYHLDFVIAGMPKCGTTTLLYALRRRAAGSGDVEIAASERCAIANVNLSPSQARQALDQAVHELLPATPSSSSSSSIVPAASSTIRRRRGIKCPTILYRYQTISRIEEYNSYSLETRGDDPPPVKFIIGLRHPIEMLQSFYNYRVTEVYDHRNDTKNTTKNTKQQHQSTIIPSFDQLMMMQNQPVRVRGGGGRTAGGNVTTISWKGVSPDIPRFELYLMQFGKTKMTMDDLNELAKRKNMAVKPGKSKIFLYTLDQIKDDDTNRAAQFRQALSAFLGLAPSQPLLEPLGHENPNHFVGTKAHPETMDICHKTYNSLRRDLLKQGKTTAQWIVNDFLKSPDVFVGNYQHFVATVQLWGTDPCAAAPQQQQQTSRQQEQ